MDDGDGSRSPSLNLGNKIFFIGVLFHRFERTFVKLLRTLQRVRMKIGAATMRWAGGRAALHFMVLMSFKRRVSAAHGRVARPKPTG
jgi:hypothetical protein